MAKSGNCLSCQQLGILRILCASTEQQHSFIRQDDLCLCPAPSHLAQGSSCHRLWGDFRVHLSHWPAKLLLDDLRCNKAERHRALKVMNDLQLHMQGAAACDGLRLFKAVLGWLRALNGRLTVAHAPGQPAASEWLQLQHAAPCTTTAGRHSMHARLAMHAAPAASHSPPRRQWRKGRRAAGPAARSVRPDTAWAAGRGGLQMRIRQVG